MMDQVVLKYPLKLIMQPQLLEVPVRAELVRFSMQRGVPTTWFLVHNTLAMKLTTVRQYLIRSTGAPAPGEPDALYRGTCEDGAYIWHLFEVLKGA